MRARRPPVPKSHYNIREEDCWNLGTSMGGHSICLEAFRKYCVIPTVPPKLETYLDRLLARPAAMNTRHNTITLVGVSSSVTTLIGTNASNAAGKCARNSVVLRYAAPIRRGWETIAQAGASLD